MNLEIFPVKPFESLKIGAYEAVAFPANHDTTVEPLLWAITENDSTFFTALILTPFPKKRGKGSGRSASSLMLWSWITPMGQESTVADT